MRVHLLGALAVVVAVAPADAHAQASDVDALIALVERQPAGMDRQTWKEQRRAAAKKLGASGDRRAVPVLIEVVKAETFDIIGEIAIDALGQLGDPAAVPVLQDVAGDASRDVTQRDAARRALHSDVRRLVLVPALLIAMLAELNELAPQELADQVGCVLATTIHAGLEEPHRLCAPSAFR